MSWDRDVLPFSGWMFHCEDTPHLFIHSPVTFFRQTLRKNWVSCRSRRTRVSSETEEPYTGQVPRGRVSEIEGSMCSGGWEDSKLRESPQTTRSMWTLEPEARGAGGAKVGREEVPTALSTLTKSLFQEPALVPTDRRIESSCTQDEKTAPRHTAQESQSTCGAKCSQVNYYRRKWLKQTFSLDLISAVRCFNTRGPSRLYEKFTLSKMITPSWGQDGSGRFWDSQGASFSRSVYSITLSTEIIWNIGHHMS